MGELHSLIRRRGLAIFLDVRAMARGLKERVPVAVARRRAEYVLIDHARVPLGFDDGEFLARHLARVHSTRHGMGFSAPRTARISREVQPQPPPTLDVRVRLRREDRQPNPG